MLLKITEKTTIKKKFEKYYLYQNFLFFYLAENGKYNYIHVVCKN